MYHIMKNYIFDYSTEHVLWLIYIYIYILRNYVLKIGDCCKTWIEKQTMFLPFCVLQNMYRIFYFLCVKNLQVTKFFAIETTRWGNNPTSKRICSVMF